MKYEGRIAIRNNVDEKISWHMMYVHTGICIKEVQKYQNIKLKTVTSVFSFSFGVQEAHMLSGNSQHTTSMSSAVVSILMNRKII